MQRLRYFGGSGAQRLRHPSCARILLHDRTSEDTCGHLALLLEPDQRAIRAHHLDSFASLRFFQNSLASVRNTSDGCRVRGNHRERRKQMKKSKSQNQPTTEAAATTAQPQTP